MTTHLIQAHDVLRRFEAGDASVTVGPITVLVPAGSVQAILGPNGSGKTTLIRLLAGQLAPSAGTATVAGFDVVRQAQQVRATVGLVTDLPALDEQRTPDSYLAYLGALYGLPSRLLCTRRDELYEVFGLGAVRERRIAQLSLGTRQKLALCRALLHQPPVLLLDEPTNALDPLAAQVVRDLIARYRQAGRAVVLCTHDLSLADDLADAVTILHEGRVVYHRAASGTRVPVRAIFFQVVAVPAAAVAEPVTPWSAPSPPTLPPPWTVVRRVAWSEAMTVFRANRWPFFPVLSLLVIPVMLGGLTLVSAREPAVTRFFGALVPILPVVAAGSMHNLVSASNVGEVFTGQLEKGTLAPLLATPTPDWALWAGKVLGSGLLPLLGWSATQLVILPAAGRATPAAWSTAVLGAGFSLGLLVFATVLASALVARTRNVAEAHTAAFLMFVLAGLVAPPIGLAALGIFGGPGLLVVVALLVLVSAGAGVLGFRWWRRDEVLARR